MCLLGPKEFLIWIGSKIEEESLAKYTANYEHHTKGMYGMRYCRRNDVKALKDWLRGSQFSGAKIKD